MANIVMARLLPIKAGADMAMSANPSIKNAIVVKRAGCEVTMKEGRDLWWHELMADPDIKAECEPEVMDSEDPLFIPLYQRQHRKTQGVVHTQAGYLLYFIRL
jgi:acetyl-CoA synthetase